MIGAGEVITDEKGILKRIMKGSIISIIITIILLFNFATILTYSNVSENIMPIGVLVITGVSILIGSQIANSHIKKNGLINGGLVGFIYIAVLYLISSLITKNFGLSSYAILMMIVSILSGSIGGIIGVNKN